MVPSVAWLWQLAFLCIIKKMGSKNTSSNLRLPWPKETSLHNVNRSCWQAVWRSGSTFTSTPLSLTRAAISAMQAAFVISLRWNFDFRHSTSRLDVPSSISILSTCLMSDPISSLQWCFICKMQQLIKPIVYFKETFW